MNPDIYSAEYQIARYKEQMFAGILEQKRQALHAKAVARRRKAKRGGKR